MNPKIWGKAGWKFLYSVALDYPLEPDFQNADNYSYFFHKLQPVLPCEICQVNYARHLQYLPITPYLNTRDQLFHWVVKMQNLVNRELGRPLLTPDDALRIYFGKTGKVIDCRIDPQIWGKAGWKFLFSVAYEYPHAPTYTDIMNYKNFFQSLQYVLPCASYRRQYSQQLNVMPIDRYLTTRSYLFTWVLEMHNMVNKEIGRPLISRQDILRVYFKNQIDNDHYHTHVTHGTQRYEGFESVFSAPVPADPNLTRKNMSMAVGVIVMGLVISQVI